MKCDDVSQHVCFWAFEAFFRQSTSDCTAGTLMRPWNRLWELRIYHAQVYQHDNSWVQT